MKTNIIHYGICLIIAFILSLPAQAQRSSSETNEHAEMTTRKSQKRERKMTNWKEKNAANAENRLSSKPQYKARTKVKIKHEKAPSEKRRRNRKHKDSEVRE